MYRPDLTKYERALIIGKRAKQLSMGDPPRIKLTNETEAVQIATKEFWQHLLDDIEVIRPFPDDTSIRVPLGKLQLTHEAT